MAVTGAASCGEVASARLAGVTRLDLAWSLRSRHAPSPEGCDWLSFDGANQARRHYRQGENAPEPPLSLAVRVPYTVGGSATEDDYANLSPDPSSGLLFLAGETTKEIPLTLLEDEDGQEKTIVLTLGELSDARLRASNGTGPDAPCWEFFPTAMSRWKGSMASRLSMPIMRGIVIGARTGAKGDDGRYSVFYNAVPDGAAFTDSAWVYGLQQNEENRSNLALVNTGEIDGGGSVFMLDIYDGDSGRLVRTVTTEPLPARRWRQINAVLANYAPGTRQGYVHIRKISGNNPFLAYGVVNDGGAPGERSGDGAYLPARK
ncbi:MAG: hypothetical protein OXI92_08395 [Acidobacteriota bacterium]|nr:hypothetical protein [Acidobacteriota bacterium]